MRKKKIMILVTTAILLLAGMSYPVQAAGNALTCFGGAFDENGKAMNVFCAVGAMYGDNLVVVMDLFCFVEQSQNAVLPTLTKCEQDG